MTRPSQRPRELGEKQIEALAVAMIVAPGVYVRNRMFDLFTSRGAQRARTRAGIVRGILPQLARANTVSLSTEMRGGEIVFVLRYAIAAVRLTRVVELSSAELAALRVVAERANVRSLPPGPNDRELVACALARLLESDGRSAVSALDPSVDVARLVQKIAAHPVE
jgi:hypothetical protein